MFVNSMVPYGTSASCMRVIPLFGQAVSQNSLHIEDTKGSSWMRFTQSRLYNDLPASKNKEAWCFIFFYHIHPIFVPIYTQLCRYTCTIQSLG